MVDLTKEQFDMLLDWLNADRDAAGLQYRTIQLRLIKIFASRGCGEAESLADTTIDRVAAKVEGLAANYVGDPALYFYGVAQKVYLEYSRKPKKVICEFQQSTPDRDDIEREHDCLEQCMGELSAKNRELVRLYYQGEKKAKINNRKKLAEALGITLDALRIRSHRIRKQLQQCVLQCVALNAAN